MIKWCEGVCISQETFNRCNDIAKTTISIDQAILVFICGIGIGFIMFRILKFILKKIKK